MVKGPNYYQRGSIQAWDFIRDQGLNFHLGNAIKYICRAGHKESKVEDLKKAIHYLENELQHTESAGKRYFPHTKPLPLDIDIKDAPGPSNRVPASVQPSWWNEPARSSEIFDR
tara:strand:- start:1963 stop:2304 length:342 start_codon:yes stop_codon:yes gene_type:complete